ncbi:hypothetical protein [Caulobacter sp. S45]|uniref:hypothetical protein n=1 Tax=Caulobacter sp. S45 TaxID=1641861 RepID=UPI0015771B14|nr:hypothetical protein [Caulobacter sp. S45]
MSPPQGEGAALLAALDELGLPWRETRAALMARYDARPHPAYQWDVVEVPGRPVSTLLWPLSIQVKPQFSPDYPAGRFSSAAYYGEDAYKNVDRAAKAMSTLLGPARPAVRHNTYQCEWRAGATSVRLTSWPPELQSPKLTNPSHEREPRLITACHVEVVTGFRPTPSPQEEAWLLSFLAIAPIRGDRRMQPEDVTKLAPMEAQVEFVREPGDHVARTFGLVGASADGRALIFCHTQLFVIPLDVVTAFRVERLMPAKGGGGSWLEVICKTGEPNWPRKTVKIHSADAPDALNDFGAELAGYLRRPFELGKPSLDV